LTKLSKGEAINICSSYTIRVQIYNRRTFKSHKIPEPSKRP
jgi:hypothetical protein